MNPLDIIIVSNSPGELSAFVQPTVEELSRRFNNARIILTFTPCQYATGRELEEARKFPGVSEIIIPQEYKKWLLKNRPPQGIKFRDKGIVIFMGGDLMHAALISKKLKYPAIAYTQKHAQWQKDFVKFLVPDEASFNTLLKKGIHAEKIRVTGDLMVDSVPRAIDSKYMTEKWKINPANPVVSFLPGSRIFAIKHMLPMFLNAANMMKKVMPQLQFLFVTSPYTSDDEIRDLLKDEGIIYSQGEHRFIQSKKGLRAQIIKNERFEAIALSDLVVTIPGTNTAQIAAMGKPMLVVFPVDKAHTIPFEGVIDLICRIPIIGMIIKKILVYIINARTKFYALPNLKAGKEVAPELRGKVTAKMVAANAVKCLNDPAFLSQISEDLVKTMGKRGAAGEIADEVARIAERNT